MIRNSTLAGRFVALTSLVTLAMASYASFDGPAMTIRATNASGTGTWEVGFDQFKHNAVDDTWTWAMNAPVDIKASTGATIATLSGMNAFYKEDPIVALGFAVIAGSSATTFQINSSLLSFAAINPAKGQASAGTSVTDVDGDGATLGNANGSKLYSAFYNGSNLFTNLVSGSTATPTNTTTVNENFGFSAISGGVSDMSSRWDFTLSANDMASGTSRYEVVPEPASLLVLGLGALAMRRRKK